MLQDRSDLAVVILRSLLYTKQKKLRFTCTKKNRQKNDLPDKSFSHFPDDSPSISCLGLGEDLDMPVWLTIQT